jgi:cytochrome c-type biogenesis protein CcsB
MTGPGDGRDLLTFAVVGYVCATGLALVYLVQREELIYRLASVATLAGWAAHTVALIVQAVQRGRPPLATLSEAVSVAAWVVVLLEMWIDRQYAVKVLGALVLPVVLMLSVSTRPGFTEIGPALRNAWIWVHISLGLIGVAAFVLNFAGALMYLLQERQLKLKRLGAIYYRLPALETLDHLTYRMLALGFPFLSTGIILGALWAGSAWGSLFTFDPLAFFSLVAWIIYAGTLAGRAAAGWRGRRAAYLAIVGFVALAVTLGAGLFIPGRHGS